LTRTSKLRRGALADALTAEGYPTRTATLATMATRGGGPPYELFGRIPLYTWGDALDWANGRLSPARCTSSEHSVLKSANQEHACHI
jgi:hypothetical protein